MVQRTSGGDFGSITQILKQVVRAVNSKENDIATVVLKDYEGRMKRRVFNNGIASDGNQIGAYSTKPMLVGSSSFPFKGAADKIFGSKKKRKSQSWVTVGTPKGNRSLVKLDGGYKQFRKLNGRQNSKVDLEMTSDLRNGIQVGTNSGKPVLGYINEESAIKGKGNEVRFKTTIFEPTISEDKQIDRNIDREVTKIIQSVLRRV